MEQILNTVEMNVAGVALCAVLALLLGTITGVVHTFRNSTNKNFIITLAVLPFIVQAVILVVNGNVGTGIAVMGAFSLVRFRSFPGSAREITSIFMAMAIGLLCGAGYALFAVIFTVIANGMIAAFVLLHFADGETGVRYLRITIPEDLDYTTVFEDIFQEYAKKTTLERVRTTNLGNLYELQYTVLLKEERREKEFLDKIRMRNSNLDINCARIKTHIKEEL
jgi:hypothetical protein